MSASKSNQTQARFDLNKNDPVDLSPDPPILPVATMLQRSEGYLHSLQINLYKLYSALKIWQRNIYTLFQTPPAIPKNKKDTSNKHKIS